MAADEGQVTGRRESIAAGLGRGRGRFVMTKHNKSPDGLSDVLSDVLLVGGGIRLTLARLNASAGVQRRPIDTFLHIFEGLRFLFGAYLLRWLVV